MNVADPSATSMAARLAARGLVSQQPYHPIALTEAGQARSRELLRRHRLIELFLTRIMGYTWDEVHDEADHWEHSVSDRFIERLGKILGNPQKDPHGQPIPGVDVSETATQMVCLSDLALGRTAEIAEVSDHDPELLRYLGSMGMYPGTVVTVQEAAPSEAP